MMVMSHPAVRDDASVAAVTAEEALLREIAEPLRTGFGFRVGSFPTAIVRGLGRRGLTLDDVADAIVRECQTPEPVEHGSDDLDFLVVVLACHVVEEARATAGPIELSRYVRCLRQAHSSGATMECLASVIERTATI